MKAQTPMAGLIPARERFLAIPACFRRLPLH